MPDAFPPFIPEFSNVCPFRFHRSKGGKAMLVASLVYIPDLIDCQYCSDAIPPSSEDGAPAPTPATREVQMIKSARPIRDMVV